MTQETQTDQDLEALRYLAGLECPTCDKGELPIYSAWGQREGSTACPDCQGTDLAFPELSRECTHWIQTRRTSDMTGTCNTCGVQWYLKRDEPPSRRIPLDDVNTALGLLVLHKDFVSLQAFDHPAQFCASWLNAEALAVACNGPTPIQAFRTAIEAAREAE